MQRLTQYLRRKTRAFLGMDLVRDDVIKAQMAVQNDLVGVHRAIQDLRAEVELVASVYNLEALDEPPTDDDVKRGDPHGL